MLLTIVEVLSCENPNCRDFAKISLGTLGARSYYCPICGKISNARAVDVNLASDIQRFETYLRDAISSANSHVY